MKANNTPNGEGAVSNGTRGNMGFYDNPIVDIYSKTSEESVIATKQVFLQKNGFLVREENPDKGVDLDVELLIDNQVSGFKFAIQIKSAQKLQTIQKEGSFFIRYNIKTSRLGYLCRRSPGFGLIVVYDNQEEQLYYDYVENIYSSIMEEHNGNEWKSNENVTFFIKTSNVVNKESIISIYETMRRRYLHFNEMYTQKAYDFDLPTFQYKEFEDPVAVLEKYGYVFFNNKEYQILFSFLSKLNLNKIVQNHKIVLLAAITYCQTGQYVEGEYFSKKCESFLSEYSDEEKELLLILKLTSEFSLGKTDRSAFYKKLKEVEVSVKGEMNSIFIGLQILFMELLNTTIIYEEKSLENVLKKIESIENQINTLEAPQETRYLYMMEVVSFVHHIGIRHFLQSITRMMIQKKILGDSPLQERLANAKLLVMLIVKPQEILQLIWDYSNKTKNDYLMATALFKKTYMFYSFSLQSLGLSYSSGTSIDSLKKTHPTNLFKQAYSEIINAYNIFQKRNDLRNAYKCLAISMEVNYLHSFINAQNIDDCIHNQITVALERLEKELNIEPYKILTEDMLINLISRKERSIFDDYYSLSTEEKYQFANIIAQSIGLPSERIDNLISEFNFMQKAEDAINTKYFDILQNLSHTKSKETLYIEAPRYVIRCKNCNYQTVESDNLDKLLGCLRAEHSHICL